MRGADPLPRLAGNVVLRRLAATDLAAFQAYRCDPAVGEYQGWKVESDAEASAFLMKMSAITLLQPGAWSQIGIANADGGLLLGDIGLFLASDGEAAEFGITLRRQSQGHGVATAAAREAINLVFEQTNARRVVGITNVRNLPSIRLLERVGMRWVESRDAVCRDQPCVEHIYAISRNPTANDS